MNNFIDKLCKEFDLQISHTQEPTRGENSYTLDSEGNIESLYLNNIDLQNLDRFVSLSDYLKILSVENCSLETVDVLNEFQKLVNLSLNGNPLKNSAYDKISQLSNLKELDLSLTTIKDTTPLGQLGNLTTLNLSYNSELIEIKGLTELVLLKHLKLKFSGINSIGNIFVNENLQFLELNGGRLEKINSLDNFSNLKELDLSSNTITKLEGLENLKELERFKISSNWIEEIEGLNCLTKLKILDLSSNEITKIKNLDSLIHLRQLNLSENKICKVENLDCLTNLEYLLLECNDIDEFDTSFLKSLKSKCSISLVENPIKEIKGTIPENIIIQFEEPNWMPKRL